MFDTIKIMNLIKQYNIGAACFHKAHVYNRMCTIQIIKSKLLIILLYNIYYLCVILEMRQYSSKQISSYNLTDVQTQGRHEILKFDLPNAAYKC